MKKQEKSLIAAELGRRGGQKTAKKGKKYMQELAMKGVAARRKNKERLSTDET